jgi:N-acetylneuraminate synthase
VRAIRTVEKALGEVHYGATAREASSRAFRRSLFVVEDVEAGEEFTSENVRSIRPGHGLHPRNLAAVLGRRAVCAIRRGAPLTWDMVAGSTAEPAIGRLESPWLESSLSNSRGA